MGDPIDQLLALLEGHKDGEPLDTDALSDPRAQQVADAINSMTTDRGSSRGRHQLFISNLSHDIRSPTNVLLGMLDLIGQSQLTAQQARWLKEARQAGGQLLELLNDVIDLSRLENGQVTLHPVPFDPADVIRSAAQRQREAAQERSLDFSVTVHHSVPNQVMADAGRVRQLAHNLVTNALRYTEQGHITVRVTRPEPGRLRIEVTDSGYTLTDPANAFSAFLAGRKAEATGPDGTGVGLAICKEIATLMGGTIGVECTPPITSFWVEVPVEEVEAAAVAALPEGKLERLLLVHERGEERHSLARRFKGEGIDVLEASDFDEAQLALARGGAIDAVVTDIHVSGQPVEALFEAIDRNPDWGNVPVTVAATSWQRGDAPRVHQMGARGYLAGSPHPSDILNIVKLTLHWSGEEDPPLFTRHHLNASVDAPKKRVLVVDDDETTLGVMVEFLRRLGCRADVAHDGIEAIEGWKRGDYDLIFMDCQMPEMDGFTATAEIRSAEGSGLRVPIVGVSASADGMQEKAHTVGMNDLCAKPVSIEELRILVLRFLGHDGGANLQQQEDAPIQESGSGIKVSGIAEIFLRLGPRYVEELVGALRGGTLEEVETLAHRLKGSCLVIGASTLARVAQSIEKAAGQNRLAEREGYIEDLNSAYEETTSAMREAMDAAKE